MALSGQPDAAYVQDIDETGPAAQADIRLGDVIVSVDGQAVGDSEDMMRIVEGHKPGDTLKVLLERKDPPEEYFARDRIILSLSRDVVLDVMPAPEASRVWLPGTGMRWDDQLRLGMSLAEITPALAEH